MAGLRVRGRRATAPLGMAAVGLFKPSAGPLQYKAEMALDRGGGGKGGVAAGAEEREATGSMGGVASAPAMGKIGPF